MSKKVQSRLSSQKLRRKANTRQISQRFLIICEGEKTEPYYFRSFPVSSAQVKVYGHGRDPMSLVKIAEREEKRDPDLDQIWCVFDRDSVPRENFEGAIQRARRHQKIKIAYSNQSFELWYILHFKCNKLSDSVGGYIGTLSRLIGVEYRKDTEMYDRLIKYQKQAISGAKKLLEEHRSSNGRLNPANDNPSTTVHQLVQELNKYISK